MTTDHVVTATGGTFRPADDLPTSTEYRCSCGETFGGQIPDGSPPPCPTTLGPPLYEVRQGQVVEAATGSRLRPPVRFFRCRFSAPMASGRCGRLRFHRGGCYRARRGWSLR